ncbi:MAG TPA: tripartite tricarboxylate transporter substrate binding protein [Xanthobacteraceae bacterium]|jgi:tripartite-type tricarboxylate transporter receptor subunit TctC
MRRRELIKAAAGAAVYAMAAPAMAQAAWPAKNKVVKVIVPWPPGAANDTLGRIVAQSIRDKFGVTVVVENQSGGSGLIGTKAVIAADPDGYTLLASAFNTVVMPQVLKAAEFDPETDLEVVARTAVAPLVCVMTGDRPQRTLADIMAAAKAEPTEWNFAIAALGAAGHLATIDLLHRSGCAIPMIGYRGTQPALLDVMTGAVQLLIDASFALLPAAKEGTKVRALGIAEAKRSILAPNIPTIAEQGLPGFEHQSWYGVWVPKGTPHNVQITINALVRETMSDPGVVAKLTETLLVPVAENIDQTKTFIHREIARSRELLQSVNFQPT